MRAQKPFALVGVILTLLALLSACTSPPPPTSSNATPTPSSLTGVSELDTIIATTLRGDVAELRNMLEYTTTRCTLAQGLGGPPKCAAGEPEGTLVQVLPLLGPEGTFLRKTDIGNWAGPQVSELLAVYEVSNAAFSDANFPAGEYALAFIGGPDGQMSVTLQVRQGRIVRIDYGFGEARNIRPENVERFLLPPGDPAP